MQFLFTVNRYPAETQPRKVESHCVTFTHLTFFLQACRVKSRVCLMTASPAGPPGAQCTTQWASTRVRTCRPPGFVLCHCLFNARTSVVNGRWRNLKHSVKQIRRPWRLAISWSVRTLWFALGCYADNPSSDRDISTFFDHASNTKYCRAYWRLRIGAADFCLIFDAWHKTRPIPCIHSISFVIKNSTFAEWPIISKSEARKRQTTNWCNTEIVLGTFGSRRKGFNKNLNLHWTCCEAKES